MHVNRQNPQRVPVRLSTWHLGPGRRRAARHEFRDGHRKKGTFWWASSRLSRRAMPAARATVACSSSPPVAPATLVGNRPFSTMSDRFRSADFDPLISREVKAL